MKPAQFEIVTDKPGEPLVIRDTGHAVGCLTVTNDVENVVQRLHAEQRLNFNRRLLYFDSENQLDEITHVEGRFTGFTPFV